LKQLLCKRGPDHVAEAVSEINKHGAPYYLSFTSTVLALRGGHVTRQPFVDPSTGSIFCWNGEAWKIGSEPVNGNDGQVVFDMLLEALSAQYSTSESMTKVLNVLKSISGPFAFVFLDRTHERIFFGRDRLGRRSLLYSTDSDSMEFSSTADSSRGIWQEVEADAIYVLSPAHGTLVDGTQHPDDILLSSPKLSPQKYDWNTNISPSVCTSTTMFIDGN
jgi:asparagine synthetase B (glutamine-hydrolysing)